MYLLSGIPTTDTPNQSNQVQLPDTIVHFMLADNPLATESYTYYFPDTVQKDRIEFYYIDSSHSAGFGYAIGKYHVIYDYDPVTGHLVHAASRAGEWNGNAVATSPSYENWDNSFVYSNGLPYPDSINIINYIDRLEDNPRTANIVRYNYSTPSDLYYAPPISSSSGRYYQIFPDDSGAFFMIAKYSLSNYPLLKYEIPGYNPGSDDHLWYFIDSANNYCQKRIYTNSFINVFPPNEGFQATGEVRSHFQYDDNSKFDLQALSRIMEPNDVIWFDMGLEFSSTTFQGRALNLWKLSCSNYVDSDFVADGNGVLTFYSTNTYQNVLTKDDKGRITSIFQYRKAAR